MEPTTASAGTKMDIDDLEHAFLIHQQTKKEYKDRFEFVPSDIDHDYVINLLKLALTRPLTYQEIKYLDAKQCIFDGESEL